MGSRGPTQSTTNKLYELHSLLLEKGVSVGKEIPRELWQQYIATAGRVGLKHVRTLTADGELHRLWARVDGSKNLGPKQGGVKLLPTPPGYHQSQAAPPPGE